MTTEEICGKLMTLLLAAVTFCILGSFVVSLDVIDFIYLIVLYTYIYLCYSTQKSHKK